MISEWPIRPGAGPTRFVLPRVHAAARRVCDAATDLALPAEHRLDDRTRAAATTMSRAVADAVERDMRLFLLSRVADRAELWASLSSATVAIAQPLLADARALDHPNFAALLLRRAEESVLSTRIAPPGRVRAAPLIDDPDDGIAAQAMELLIAQARRVDRFGDPLLLFDDLPAELAHWFAWTLAAALRHYLTVRHGVGDAEADALLIAAAGSVLATHDEARGLAATAGRLAARLLATDRIDGPMLQTMLAAGQVPAFVAALAARAGLPQPEVWNLIADPADGRCAALLRAAGVDRASAASVLLILLDGRAPDEVDVFDRIHPDEARDALAPLTAPPEFRAAVLALDIALAAHGAVK